MPFRIALSGLNAAASELNVTANNIANANSTGFKSSRAEFADVFAVGALDLRNTQVGNGTRLANIAQQFSQGNISFTNSNLDLSISGDGFFTMRDANGFVYSRNGALEVDRDGFVVNAKSQRLQVYPPLPTGGFNTGTLTDLALATTQSAPQATDSGEVILNLPATASPPAVAPFNPNDPQSYNNSTSTAVFDSLGNLFNATFYFVKTATPNQWDVGMAINGTAINGPGGTPLTTVTFDSTGRVTAPAGGSIAFQPFNPGTGANPLTMTFDFGKMTQFGDQAEWVFIRALDDDRHQRHRCRLCTFHQWPRLAARPIGSVKFPESARLASAGRYHVGRDI
jgi:flagellar hook protein FlgE